MEQHQTQLLNFEGSSQGSSILQLRLHLQDQPHVLYDKALGSTMVLSDSDTSDSSASSSGTTQDRVSYISKRWEKINMKKRGAMSRLDLEFQELKGVMELGFVFNKDELSPRLMDLLPGLKRLITTDENNVKARAQKQEQLLVLPPPIAEKGDDMKERVKFWARSVASAIRASAIRL